LNLSATFSSTQPVGNVRYKFEASVYEDNWKNLSPGGDLTIAEANIDYTMLVLGEIKFRVTVTYTCGVSTVSVTSNEQISNSKYCSEDLISDCAADFNAAWANTLTSTASGNGKYEFGFYRIFNYGSFENQHFDNFAPCDNLINESKLGYVVPPKFRVNPLLGDKWYVGKFHTHPPLTNCEVGYFQDPGPSSIDFQNLQQIPQIVRTYPSRVYSPHPANLDTHDHTYDSNCTNY